MMREPLAELFAMVQDGRLRTVSAGRYTLADARRAHEDMLARRTTGKVVLEVVEPGAAGEPDGAGDAGGDT